MKRYIILLFTMWLIGILYGVVYHQIIMPMTGNDLLHCLIMGVIFSSILYLILLFFIRLHFEIKTDNKILKEKIKIDKLTGLLNRSSLDYELTKINKSTNNYSIVFIDIDNFKQFNDKYGHKVGDDILRKVSQEIIRNVRPQDKVYRYGGEEIVIILKDCAENETLIIAERVRVNISKLNNHPYANVTVSIGISSYQGVNNIYEAVGFSDKALLLAKKSGKNCTRIAN